MSYHLEQSWSKEVGGDERVSRQALLPVSACFPEWNGYSSNSPILIFFSSSENRRAMFGFLFSCDPWRVLWGNHTTLPERFEMNFCHYQAIFLYKQKILGSPRLALPFSTRGAISLFSFLWQSDGQLVLQQDCKALNASVYVLLSASSAVSCT